MAISEPGNLPAVSRVEPGSASGKVESIVGAQRLLTINTGSASLKAALYRLWEDTTETPDLRAEASRIGGRGGGLRLADARGETLKECRDDLPDHIAALDALLSRLRDRGLDRDDLAADGHRIVHGGDRHREPQRVAPELVADLRALVPIDPNHLPQAIAAIEAVSRAYPAVPQVACFDTAFHSRMPRVARLYALPSRLTEEGIIRYGFHGLSYEYVMEELRRLDREAAAGCVVVAPRQRGEHGRRPGRRRRRHDHGLHPDRRARDGHEERRPRPGSATLFVGGAGHVPDRSERSPQQAGRPARRLGDECGHARLAGPRARRRTRCRGGRSLLLPGEEISGGFGRCSWRARRSRLHGRHRRARRARARARLRGPRVPRHPARHRSQRGARAGHLQRRRRGDRPRRADRRRFDGRPAHEKAHRAGTLSREEQRMYRFDPTISSVVEEVAAPPRPALSPEAPAEGPLSAEQLAGIQRYWQAANYLTAGQIYLQDNPLLREPLRPSHIKPRLLGHWGTSPGLNLLYTHLNRLIRERGAEVIYLAGPGHGGPAVLANVYLEGTYSEVYPEVSRDSAGMRRLFRQFSTPGGVPSHVSVPTPGSINEGGELGYVLTHAFGAAFDNPDLLVAAVVGDGEAETGPLEGSWKSVSFLNPARDGAVLPILHLNGYKIANPTVLGRASDDEVRSILEGHGYAVHFVEGDDPAYVHQAFAAVLDRCYEEILSIQQEARENGVSGRPRWPAIVLRTPKGWTGPQEVNGLPVAGTFRSHQVPLSDVRSDPEQLARLEGWMRSYQPEELFDGEGRLVF